MLRNHHTREQMLKLVQITPKNLKISLETFHRIFSWLDPHLDPYSGSFINGRGSKFYLVYDEGQIVGITGFYTVPGDSESAWLGWFGVVPEMRKKHYGAKILALHEDDIRKAGFRYSRLYTENENNDATRHFYEKCGYVSEEYNCPQEPVILKGLLVTYSKSLGDWPLVPWNSRNMGIYEMEKWLYTEEQLAHAEGIINAYKAANHE